MAEQEKVATKAKRPSAIKRDIQSRKRNQANRQFKARVKTAIRCLDQGLEAKDTAGTPAHLNEVYSLLDKGVKKGIVPANTARRTKSRLANRLVAKS